VDLPTTLALGGLFFALSIFCGWRGAGRADPARGVRMVPWRFLMLLSGAGLFLMLIHLSALLGVNTYG
jgi:hypothetical protein